MHSLVKALNPSLVMLWITISTSIEDRDINPKIVTPLVEVEQAITLMLQALIQENCKHRFKHMKNSQKSISFNNNREHLWIFLLLINHRKKKAMLSTTPTIFLLDSIMDLINSQQTFKEITVQILILNQRKQAIFKLAKILMNLILTLIITNNNSQQNSRFLFNNHRIILWVIKVAIMLEVLIYLIYLALHLPQVYNKSNRIQAKMH